MCPWAQNHPSKGWSNYCAGHLIRGNCNTRIDTEANILKSNSNVECPKQIPPAALSRLLSPNGRRVKIQVDRHIDSELSFFSTTMIAVVLTFCPPIRSTVCRQQHNKGSFDLGCQESTPTKDPLTLVASTMNHIDPSPSFVSDSVLFSSYYSAQTPDKSLSHKGNQDVLSRRRKIRLSASPAA